MNRLGVFGAILMATMIKTAENQNYMAEEGVRSELFSTPITRKKAGELPGKWRQFLDKKLAITWLGTMCGETVTASDQGINRELHHRPPGRSRAETSARPVLHFDKKRWKSAAS